MRFTILEEIKKKIAQIIILQSVFTNQIKCWIFDERGKPEYPGENLS